MNAPSVVMQRLVLGSRHANAIARVRVAAGMWLPAVVTIAMGLGSTACETTLSLQALDGLNRSIGSQTIALRDTHTVYSPYDWVATRDFADVVGTEVAAVSSLLEVSPKQPVPVWLRATQGIRPKITSENGVMHMQMPERHPHFGIEGYAGDEMVVVYVEETAYIQGADGKTISGNYAASTYQSTIRHELVHYLSFAADLRGELWFNEGLPEEIETMRSMDGRLVMDPRPRRLLEVASIPRAERSLRSVLDWQEDAAMVHDGRERADIKSRMLAHSFVRFLLEHDPDHPFVARVRWILSLSRRQLLSFEPAWQDWLDALASTTSAAVRTPSDRQPPPSRRAPDRGHGHDV